MSKLARIEAQKAQAMQSQADSMDEIKALLLDVLKTVHKLDSKISSLKVNGEVASTEKEGKKAGKTSGDTSGEPTA